MADLDENFVFEGTAGGDLHVETGSILAAPGWNATITIHSMPNVEIDDGN